MTEAYWQINLNKTKVQTTRQDFDVCIIGAGIAGISTAYWLEKNNPQLKIGVIDKIHLGAGASGRNAGFVTCGSAEHFQKLINSFGLERATEIWKFSEKNRDLLLSEIIQDQFSDFDFKLTGSCTVAATTNDWDRYQTLAETMKAAGIDIELIDETYLNQHYGVTGFSGALQYLHDGVIHPIKLLEKIKSKLKNTEFIFGENIQNIQSKNNQHTIQLQTTTLYCEKIFSCLNGFTADVLSDYKKLILPQRGQVILTEPLPAFVKGPCYLTKHLCYFRQLLTGELLVGGFRNHDIENENTSQDAITDKIQTALNEFTQSYFTNTKNVKINYRWSGIMGFTPDGQMIIGELPDRKNFFIMGGCSGHGMGLSFHAAKVLADSSTGGIIPEQFRIGRF